jgi:hypothetical protein
VRLRCPQERFFFFVADGDVARLGFRVLANNLSEARRTVVVSEPAEDDAGRFGVVAFG